MIDRKELAEELILRENVRKAISVILRRRDTKVLQEQKDEIELRSLIRGLVVEGQSAVATDAKHDSTGINTLEDLLKNTNVLSVLQTGYKSLTTRDDDDPPEGQTKQRLSYQNHILNAVKNSLAPEESRKEAGENAEITEDLDEDLDEDINITIGGRPEDDPDFIDVEDGETEEVEVDEKEEFGIEGEDKTGRNKAFTDFQDIEKVILTSFDDLDNTEDIAMFEEYLLKNLTLYFEKYEGELDPNVAAPEESENAVADADVDISDSEGLDADTDMPAFELQEVMKFLDIDDIIENLL